MLTSRQHDRLIMMIVLCAIISICIYMFVTHRKLKRDILGSVSHTERQCEILKSDINSTNMRIAGVKAQTQSIEEKAALELKELRERMSPPHSEATTPTPELAKKDPLPADFF